MDEQVDSFKSKANVEIRNFLSSPEKYFFTIFLAIAVIGWSAGIGALQLNEYKINREIARAIQAENYAKSLRLEAINTAWTEFNFKDWYFSNTSGEYFRWNTFDRGTCRGSKDCFSPTIMSKFDCDSVIVNWEFTKNDLVLSQGRASKEFVSSMVPFSLYIESTSTKSAEFVDITSFECIGKSY